MNNILLIGMMGCGKTTLGAMLAKKLGREYLSTDAVIEKQEGRTISEIFSTEGEAHFRALERIVSNELGKKQDLVIACGGGMPINEGCMAALKPSGTVIWLRRDPGEAYDTMDIIGRPLAQNGRQSFLNLYARREPIYRQWADLTVDVLPTAELTLNHILEALKCEF